MQHATVMYCTLTKFGFDAVFYTKTHITLVTDPVKSTIDFLLSFAFKEIKSQQTAVFVGCPTTWKSVPTP